MCFLYTTPFESRHNRRLPRLRALPKPQKVVSSHDASQVRLKEGLPLPNLPKAGITTPRSDAVAVAKEKTQLREKGGMQGPLFCSQTSLPSFTPRPWPVFTRQSVPICFNGTDFPVPELYHSNLENPQTQVLGGGQEFALTWSTKCLLNLQSKGSSAVLDGRIASM